MDPSLEVLKTFLLRMQRAGELVAVAPNRYYLPSQVEGLVAVARQLVADSPSGSFNAAEYRDASGIGRNLTIQVLEYLDRAGVTRFVREQRFLVAGCCNGWTSSPVGRPDFNSGEMRNARLVGSTPMSFRHPAPSGRSALAVVAHAQLGMAGVLVHLFGSDLETLFLVEADAGVIGLVDAQLQ